MWEEYTIEAAANKEDLRRLVKKMKGNDGNLWAEFV